MSDFFDDDFTADLRAYFLDAISAEAQRFIDLIDERHWQRIRTEVLEQVQIWAVDARSNEFLFLQLWLENYEQQILNLDTPGALTGSLQALQSYAAELKHVKDSSELAEKYARAGKEDSRILYLHCSFGPQDFAIPVSNVAEIIGYLPVFPLPQKQARLLGVVPFRGEAVPVIDLFEFGFVQGNDEKTFYVICQVKEALLSLQVNMAYDLVYVGSGELSDIEVLGSPGRASFVQKFFLKDEKSVMVLDLEKMVA